MSDKEIKFWFTTKTGKHVPVFEGETKAEALKRVVSKSQQKGIVVKSKTDTTVDKKSDFDEEQQQKEKQIAIAKNANTNQKSTQTYHKESIKELSDSKYTDGTYDIDTKKTKSFPKGYQVTFCQIGDNYTDKDYQGKVDECLKMSSDGKTYAGKFGGTPEISFHCDDKEQAIAYAKANNQISIWDWENGLEIDTGGSGDRNKTRAQVEKEWEKAKEEEERAKAPKRLYLDDISAEEANKTTDILDLQTKDRYSFKSGTKLTGVYVFAGKGCSKVFRDAEKYAKRWGGKASEWQHCAGMGYITNGKKTYQREIHWVQGADGKMREAFIKYRY